MTVQDWLAISMVQLSEVGISTARLDSLVLLEDCLGKNRAHLLAHPEIELTVEQTALLAEQISRRATHAPLAYIRGKTEFYSREFTVNENVLEPRPESETMIDALKTLRLPASATIIDVGTGSGALAITAKLELPQNHVIGVDIDPDCLKVAQDNAQNLHADIKLMLSDLIGSLTVQETSGSVLLCNLPYVPDSFQINTAALHEPKLAIFGGPDGLDLFRKLFRHIDGVSAKPTYILSEAMPTSHETLTAIARKHGYTQIKSEDFIQVFAFS